MKKRILKALNNEYGGPNVEQVVAIGVALGIMTAVYSIGRALYSYIHSIAYSKTGVNNGSIVIGYN